MKVIRNKNNYNLVVELRKQNKTVPEICKELNISKGTVGYYLTKAYNDDIVNLSKMVRISPISPEKNELIKKQIKEKKINTCNQKIIEADFNTLSFERLRKRIMLEQNETCIKCGIKEWQGVQLSLEIDHIDGNHKNNKRENIEALCPNCHSITPTWRGRNKTQTRNNISDDLIIDKIIELNFNIRQVLLSVGLAAKGGNYKRIHRLIRNIKENNI